MTLKDYLNEQLKDPEFKREYDALEGWYQSVLREQEGTSKRVRSFKLHPMKGARIKTAIV